jgi:hypothetical protein
VGAQDLRNGALRLAAAGVTTLAEVMRIAGDPSQLATEARLAPVLSLAEA